MGVGFTSYKAQALTTIIMSRIFESTNKKSIVILKTDIQLSVQPNMCYIVVKMSNLPFPGGRRGRGLGGGRLEGGERGGQPGIDQVPVP